MRGVAIIDRTMLTRIVALLFALAGLAERAAGASFPVRLFVLFLLRRAETAARAYAIGGGAASLATPVRHEGCRPADAARLALRFRLLALALRVFASRIAEYFPGRARSRADLPRRGGGIFSRAARDPAGAPNGFAVAARLDTS